MYTVFYTAAILGVQSVASASCTDIGYEQYETLAELQLDWELD